MKKRFFLLLILTIGTNVYAQDMNRFAVKLTGGYSIPNENSKVAILGGKISANNAWHGGIAGVFYLTPNWSAQLSVLTSKRKINLSEADLQDLKIRGDKIPFGKVWTTPVNLAVQYHLTLFNRIQPYAGIGVNYMFLHHADEGWALQNISYKNVWGGIVQLGVDINITNRIFAGAEMQKTISDRSNIDLDFSNTISQYVVPGQIKLNNLDLLLHIGYRF